jgi:predicted ester cyclase
MSPEENKALVHRFYQEIDRGNLEAMDELVAEDYLDHNPPPFPGLPPGRAGLKQAFTIFWEATPGYHRVEDQIAEDDKVVTRLTAIGKHEGDLPGAPRTGNALQMTSITIHRIAKGQLAEKWAEKDVLSFLQQIGVMPAPEHPTWGAGARAKLTTRKVAGPLGWQSMYRIGSTLAPLGESLPTSTPRETTRNPVISRDRASRTPARLVRVMSAVVGRGG